MATDNNIKVSEILRHLRARVEDLNDLGFSKQEKLDALDTSQRYLCSVIHNYYLNNLEVSDDVTTDGDGKITYSQLSNKVFRNDILGISTVRDGHLMTLDNIEYEDVGRLNHTYLQGNFDYQMWYKFKDGIHVYPSDSTLTYTVSYIKQPDMFYDDEDGEEATVCDLDIVLLDPLLDFAEANLWKIDNKQNRTKMAFEMGVNNVNLLNERFAQERTTGINQTGQGQSQ
ncbi:MAG: hypothetical protein Tp1124DCM412261_36 [Prokaryotic dsDNA virus sp.]|nr:MAG: hypothetical protein Tp1123DCM939791_42 [Prokaryotic dsDNA virus sp.]QDP59868.1 MAG: hypothetical protein Tp1124DCM412261_36 [Prokaryotic dsDNA virus sp.]|tara:strand:+ start:14221 stop:14904 length:684 start_codon:yes stop_codon:yes gene_type:complete